ncbi:Leucine-binding protein domain-containing protein [Bordetella sputigena]|uniref:ABC transporter substrate-binding protein n=1 Tax=Bordetella sputigena TaxID=1416810 RepID=UPI0039F0AFD6
MSAFFRGSALRPRSPFGGGSTTSAVSWVMLGRAVLACAMLIASQAAYAAPAGKAARPAPPPPPLRIGEINTYKTLPAFSEDYRRGWTLALEQINADGGVLGRKLEVRSRDDRGSPDDAVQAAQALVDKDGAVALFGGYSSEVGLALSRYADTAKVPYLAVAPLSQRLTWQDGNRYTFRLRPGAWMQAAAVAPKALGLRKLRWALVYQDTESDRATAEAFKGLVKTFQSKTEFVDEIAVPAGKFDAVATVAALSAARPEAIFNMLTGQQLAALVRAGAAANLFNGLGVVSLFMGDPENLGALDEASSAAIPDGWIITGYPRDAVDTLENQAFLQAYRDRYGDAPGMAAVLGYSALRSITEALKRAGTPDREALASAFPRLQVPTPFGTIEYRNLDHQSTLGIYLGYTGHVDGRLTMDRFVYATGARLQPLDEQIRRLRVQSARSSTGTDAAAAGSAAAAAAGGKAAGQGDGAGPAADAAHPVATPARPTPRPDTGLTSRLRAARPGAAPAATGTQNTGAPSGASAVSGIATNPSATDGHPVREARPGVGTSTPAMADWPDQVSQRGAAAH